MKRNRIAALLLALCITAALLPGAAFAAPAADPVVTYAFNYNAALPGNEVVVTVASATPGATVSGTIGGVAFAGAAGAPYVSAAIPMPTAGLAVTATATAGGFTPSATVAVTIPAPKAAKPTIAYQKEDNFSKLQIIVTSTTPMSMITCTVNGETVTGVNPFVLHMTMRPEGLLITAKANAASFSTSDTADIFLRASLFEGGVDGVNPSLPVLYPEKGAAQFTDVPENAWYRADLETLVRAGVIDGVTEDSFKPHDTLTMAQFVKMLTAALYGDGVEKYKYHMVDNRYDTWYAKYVGAALAGGLTAGVEVNYEKLESGITRYDMAALLINAAKTLGENPEILPDIYRHIADYYDMPLDKRDAVAKAYSAGLLEGYDEYGNFYGDKILNRCEACAVIVRLFDAEARPAVK